MMYREARNLIGEMVLTRYTKRERHGVWEVHERTTVGGTPVADVFYPMDTVEGRDKMAKRCISPDMLESETGGAR